MVPGRRKGLTRRCRRIDRGAKREAQSGAKKKRAEMLVSLHLGGSAQGIRVLPAHLASSIWAAARIEGSDTLPMGRFLPNQQPPNPSQIVRSHTHTGKIPCSVSTICRSLSASSRTLCSTSSLSPSADANRSSAARSSSSKRPFACSST